MKPAPFDIVMPASVDEALQHLSAHPPEAVKILAGGQSLVPMLAMRLAAPGLLIDLNRVVELSGIRPLGAGALEIGAMTRHRQVERSPLVARLNPLLAQAMPWIAHVQVRNRGTIGGSLVHADPAAELPAVCLASDAVLDLRGPRGPRQVAAEAFFRGIFDTDVRPEEILASVRFPAWPAGRCWAFEEVARRHGDFALCGVALTLDPAAPAAPAGGPPALERVRIVAFGVGDRPQRLSAAETALRHQIPTPERIQAAAAQAASGLEIRGDHHASPAYRRELLEVLTRRALQRALRRPAAPAAGGPRPSMEDA